MADDRIVLCMKWGTLFPADYVNVLFNACRNAITGPFRFVCLTDDSEGFIDGVESYKIPEIGLSPDEWYTPGVWPKLALYVADLHGLRGRCLFIDLDMIVVDGLDEMFTRPERFITINVGDEWRRGRTGARGDAVGTGVIGFDLGRETHILEAFLADKSAAKRDFANEQEFVAAQVPEMGYWPRGWVISFKRHLRRPVGVDLFMPPKPPPPGSRIVAFHGDPRPIDLMADDAGFWDRFPHMGHGPVRWVREYWTSNGGRLPPFE